MEKPLSSAELKKIGEEFGVSIRTATKPIGKSNQQFSVFKDGKEILHNIMSAGKYFLASELRAKLRAMVPAENLQNKK